MRIIKQSHEILAATPDLEKLIERAGRIAWKSEEKITADSYIKFIDMIKGKQHESVLEHGSISVLFITDRGVTHELVRHRIASFTQESTRYCNYANDKFGNELTFIEPAFWGDNKDARDRWESNLDEVEYDYMELIESGAIPQEARSILPNSLKTEIVVTANPREWRHIFKMRTAKSAHPQIRDLMIPCLAEFIKRWPSLFGDL